MKDMEGLDCVGCREVGVGCRWEAGIKKSPKRQIELTGWCNVRRDAREPKELYINMPPFICNYIYIYIYLRYDLLVRLGSLGIDHCSVF